MRIRLPHSPYIANKVTLDLLNSGYVKMKSGLDPIKDSIRKIIDLDIKKELALEESVNEKLDDSEDDIEYLRADYRQLFRMVKKRLAPEFGVILNFEDRYSNLSHEILDELWNEDLMDYSVTENKIRNTIYNAISNYINSFEDIEDIVFDKMDSYKRKLQHGSEEFDIIFKKLYEEELKKKGIL